MKKGDLKSNFDNLVGTVAHTVIDIGNDTRQLEHAIGALRNGFLPHILAFRAVSKLVDVIDAELTKENPGPIVTKINTSIEVVRTVIDDVKEVITSNLSNTIDEVTETVSVDNTLLIGDSAGNDFQNI